jgi:hypothetical protein
VSDKYLPDGYSWLVLGARIYPCLKQDRLASAAHTARIGVKLGIFSDSSSWRTAALMNYKITEI